MKIKNIYVVIRMFCFLQMSMMFCADNPYDIFTADDIAAGLQGLGDNPFLSFPDLPSMTLVAAAAPPPSFSNQDYPPPTPKKLFSEAEMRGYFGPPLLSSAPAHLSLPPSSSTLPSISPTLVAAATSASSPSVPASTVAASTPLVAAANVSATLDKKHCVVCNKIITPHNMARHKRTHTGERPFSCQACPKSFTNSASLKKHTLTHTGEKPFTCDICGKSTAEISNLKAHKKRKH